MIFMLEAGLCAQFGFRSTSEQVKQSACFPENDNAARLIYSKHFRGFARYIIIPKLEKC